MDSLRKRLVAGGSALALAFGLTAAAPALAERLSPPPVPAELAVDPGSRPFFAGRATGTQNYVCLPAGTGFAWTLFQPEATLFDLRDKQLATHFFRPNPFEGGTFRPAWQHSRDTSVVWARLGVASADAAYVAPGAVPWLLLEVAGAAPGPNGGATLARTTQIHRVNTFGGVAPAGGCAAAQDVGKKALVPYEADYFFYENRGRDQVERED
jgi:hypothetical protein